MKGMMKKMPLHSMTAWVKGRPVKIKVILGVVTGLVALVFLRMVVRDHDKLFVAAEAVHALGISSLIYKLTKEKTCAGLSLKSQMLTAVFLAARLYSSVVVEYDIHTVLDTATLITTLWVIYMIRFKLRASYMADKDNLRLTRVTKSLFEVFSQSGRSYDLTIEALQLYLFGVIPCIVFGLFIKPYTMHIVWHRILWAVSVYLETVSVLPQLRVMQNTKVVEPLTAHYVFALGIARFLTCAHWVLKVLDSRGEVVTVLGYGPWPYAVLLSEVVQTFILADFCYYYVKSLVSGQLVVRLPAGVV